MKRDALSPEEKEWLVQTVKAVIGSDTPNGKVAGEWPSIHQDFCSRFGTNKSLKSLQMAYYRATQRAPETEVRAAEKRVRKRTQSHLHGVPVRTRMGCLSREPAAWVTSINCQHSC